MGGHGIKVINHITGRSLQAVMSTQLTLSNTQFDVIGEDVDILSSLKWPFARWVEGGKRGQWYY